MFISPTRTNAMPNLASPSLSTASQGTTALRQTNLTDGTVIPPRTPPKPQATAITNMEVFQQLVKYGNELKAMEERYSAENAKAAMNVIRDLQ